MSQYTSDEGVYEVWEAISVLEQITLEPWEHSASENLFIRKLHYERKRTAGYSFWPMGGWDALWNRMADAIRARGGAVTTRATVEEVVVRDGAVKGVRLKGGEELEAAEVVVNAPVWDLNKLFADDALPWDFTHRVKSLAANQNRACWFGYWIAAEEPVIASSTLEMASFFTTPRAGLPGYTLCFTGYDPSVSPPGEYLTCVGAAFDATKHYGDRAYYDRKFAELWEDIEEMMPAAKGALWKKPHLVNTYGVICKPGQVGAARPDTVVRGVDGLYLTGDTTRARGIGIDKAARSGITTAETVLGGRDPFFADTVALLMGRLDGKVGGDHRRRVGARRGHRPGGSAEEGARVVVADLQADQARAVADSLPGEAIGVSVDVGDRVSTEEMAAAAKDAFGGIDVVFANAGIPGEGSVHDMDPPCGTG